MLHVLEDDQPVRARLVVDQYLGGRMRVQLLSDGKTRKTLSINLVDPAIGLHEFVFKTYRENEGLLEQLEAAGRVERTGKTVVVGPGPQPICRLLCRFDELDELPGIPYTMRDLPFLAAAMSYPIPSRHRRRRRY